MFFIKLGVPIVTALVLYVSVSAAAQAMPVSAAQAVTNAETELCLASDANRVYPSQCDRDISGQQWTFGDGVTLKNLATGLCLASDANKMVSTSPCDAGSSYQRWALGNSTTGNGTTLENLATGLCLASDARSVYTSRCDGGPSQQWSGI